MTFIFSKKKKSLIRKCRLEPELQSRPPSLPSRWDRRDVEFSNFHNSILNKIWNYRWEHMEKIADRTRIWNKEGTHEERFNALRVLQRPGTLRRLDRIQNWGKLRAGGANWCMDNDSPGLTFWSRRQRRRHSPFGMRRPTFVCFSLTLTEVFIYFFIYRNLPLNLGGEDSQPGGSHARILQLCRLQRKHDLWTFPGLMLWFTFLFVSALPTHHFFFHEKCSSFCFFLYMLEGFSPQKSIFKFRMHNEKKSLKG